MINLNPIVPLRQTLNATREDPSVFLCILAISWFWFFGASLLTVLPTYTKEVLAADEQVVTFLLSIFCVGTALGSLFCERMGGKQLELGVVPVGSIGMTIAAFDLFFCGTPGHIIDGDALNTATLLGLRDFLAAPGSVRICLDFLCLAICGGLYTVPLYTLIQQRVPEARRSRVIAGNNILNALFMVLSAGMLIVASAVGLSIPQIFGLLAVMGAAAALYIYTVVPEFLLRFVAWLLAHLMYRVRIVGRHHIPIEGAAVLVANHVSYVDWLLLATTTQRPIRFVMHHSFMKIPLASVVFRDAKVIPIASAKEDKGLLDETFDAIASALQAGELVCIFPEGRLTPDGKQGIFRPGIERIIARNKVPVIPIALGGMWGAYFSRIKEDISFRRLFQRVGARVQLTIGDPVPPGTLSATKLGQIVADLGGWKPDNQPLPKA